MLLLCDRKVMEKPIAECGESLADFREYTPNILVDLSRQQIGSRSDAFLKARQTVIEKVLSTSKNLPIGIKFLIKEAYRPPHLQQRFFDSYCAVLEERHPEYSSKEIFRDASKYVSPVAVAPHPTGGAVDLTLAWDDGTELDMGTRFNASPTETQNACFTSATNISNQARSNREILISTLRGAGMVNYPTEWWHWSFGDKYWAVVMNEDCAVYDALEEKDLI